MRDLGRRVYGLAAIALGLIGLRWDDFAAVWQPVPKTLPGHAPLALAAALLFLMAGIGMQWRRTLRVSALALAGLYLVFALLWARRVVGFPQIFGTWSGAAEQLALVAGGVLAFVSVEPPEPERRAALSAAVRTVAQLVFGLSLLAFGVSHFIYVKETAAMAPRWLPLGQTVWAHLTGLGHIAAGLSLIAGVLAVIAARLLTLMFAVFGVLVWLPRLLHHPGDHMVWCGNAINLALIGAAWVVADTVARFGVALSLSARPPEPEPAAG